MAEETSTQKLAGKKIGILIESDYYEHEIWYYKYRFEEEGAELHFLTRLWGQQQLTFSGHEYKVPFTCNRTFEGMDDDTLRSYAAIIVPSAIVSDRLRYSESIPDIPPAAQFLRRAFQEEGILKGIICHGMWLVSPIAEVIKDRPVVCHNNLYWDVLHMGARYRDEDVVVDGDLVTARSGDHAGLFAHKIVELLSR